MGKNFVRVCLNEVLYLCYASVIVVKTVEHWERDDLSFCVFILRSLNSLRYFLLDPLMWSSLVEELHVFLNDPIQIAFTQNQHVIQKPLSLHFFALTRGQMF